MSYHSRQPSVASSLLSSYNHTHPQKIGPWKLGKTLGRGATGRVLLATHSQTGQKAAVKVVSKSELQDENEPPRTQQDNAGLPYGIEREIIIMKLLTHPNVLRLYDVWETSKALYLVLEYVEGGELFDLLVERGPLQEVEAVKYFRQIVLGTAYCHALGICHRDLKPENLLLDGSLNVKLADFGMAALESNGKLLETSCGSPHYAAPEIVSGLKYHGAASDVWSCGVILFALLTGRLPFDDEHIRNLLLKVQAGNFEMAEELSDEAKDLIYRMLTVDPMKRIQTGKILHHPLLTKYPIPNEDLISVKSLPHPETAYKSLGSVKNIDPQILQNLSILWHNRPQQEIIDCLLKNGTNPEKTFYALLMRYRHDQEESQTATPIKGSPAKSSIPGSSSFSSKRGASTPKRKSIPVSRSSTRNRPLSFQYKNGVRTSVINTNGRVSASPSVQSSPYKSPHRSPHRSPHKSPRRNSNRYSYSQSPRKSPRKSGYFEENEVPPAIPRNIYNEIMAAQKSGSLGSIPPTLNEKDELHGSAPARNNQKERNPIVDEAPKDLLESAKISSSKSNNNINKRSSVISHTTSKNRLSKRKSMTTGLKRNSITVKLLSTYAKLAGESDWEYMDKSAKRTSASFATLCDKIFNQEDYKEEDEILLNQEEKEAKEYERIMEQERRKHEAEYRARKELAKQRKRQKRKSLLSSKKLSIFIKDENNEAKEITADTISQPKRKSLRALSEGTGKTDKLTVEDVENFKRRSVTQPTQRRTPPNLARRPVSRLDPLWTTHEHTELDRAEDALRTEYMEATALSKRASDATTLAHELKYSKDDYYKDNTDYELPEPDVPDHDLSSEYMSEIRKSKLLNSQLNIKSQLEEEEEEPKDKTLIANVKIPKVTRKSRCFTNSNKRLSVLTMYSTKTSYKDLNSILKDEDHTHGSSKELRTSYADRLNRQGLPEEEVIDEDNVMDFDDLNARRASFYTSTKTFSKYKDSTRQTSERPVSELPKLPTKPYNMNAPGSDDTFATKTDEVHERDDESPDGRANDSVFDNIKLPEKSNSVRRTPPTNNQVNLQSSGTSQQGTSMLMTGYNKAQTSRQYEPKPEPMSKVRKPKAFEDYKKPLEDTTNFADKQPSGPAEVKKKGSIFRKLSWGMKKNLEEPSQMPTSAEFGLSSGERKTSNSFFRWFSGSHEPIDNDVKKFKTILPRQEMSTALFALLNSWSNFGLKSLKIDTILFNITGAITSNNAFNLKSCKFRIKINSTDNGQKSEILCSRVKGSKVTTDTLFKEIEKVLVKEGVMDY